MALSTRTGSGVTVSGDETVAGEIVHVTDVNDLGKEVELTDLMGELAEIAREQKDNPQPVMAGTFAMYPMEDGGVMVVMSGDVGPVIGVQHVRMRPGLMRAINVLAGGGSKLAALKALRGGRKEIEK